MPKATVRTIDPTSDLLRALARIANRAFESPGNLRLDPNGVGVLLSGMFELLAEANESNDLAKYMQHLEIHGNLLKWLIEHEDSRGRTPLVDTYLAREIVEQIREKWFPKGPPAVMQSEA